MNEPDKAAPRLAQRIHPPGANAAIPPGRHNRPNPFLAKARRKTPEAPHASEDRFKIFDLHRRKDLVGPALKRSGPPPPPPDAANRPRWTRHEKALAPQALEEWDNVFCDVEALGFMRAQAKNGTGS